MCKMLLSINPEHVENIMNGSKLFEFRKVRCREDVDKIIFYSTSPVMKVVGEAQVLEIIVDNPELVWEITSEFSGITKLFYDEYFKNKEKAVAYRLGKVEKYRLSVVIRSFIGLSLAYPWKTGITLPLIFILAVFFGKAFGGILADRFGWMRISIVGLLLSAPLLFFGAYEPMFAIFGIFFFNLTMPVTLVAIANLLPRYAGFSLGLTTMAIFIGLIAAVTPLKKIVYARLWPISIIILCSAGILFIGLRLYNMSMKNPDCKVVETETTAIVEQL